MKTIENTRSNAQFGKSEKLCSKKEIAYLFEKGSATVAYPFKLYTLDLVEESLALPKLLISVPKRAFKKATQRNLLKRRVREAYRLQKAGLLAQFKAPKRTIGILYIAKEPLPLPILIKKLQSAFQKAAGR